MPTAVQLEVSRTVCLFPLYKSSSGLLCRNNLFFFKCLGETSSETLSQLSGLWTRKLFLLMVSAPSCPQVPTAGCWATKLMSFLWAMHWSPEAAFVPAERWKGQGTGPEVTQTCFGLIALPLCSGMTSFFLGNTGIMRSSSQGCCEKLYKSLWSSWTVKLHIYYLLVVSPFLCRVILIT